MKRRNDLKDAQVFCFFVGYMRSGHTLVGSLLNAHPNIVISNELGALSLLAKGYSISQIFYLCLEKDREFERQGRTWTGYKYAVKGGHQGEFEQLRVIGDKHDTATVYDFDHRPKLFDILSNLEVKIRVFHHTRNPFDIIATGYQKGGDMSLRQSSEYFLRQAAKAEEIIGVLKEIDGVSVMTTRHEELVGNSRPSLRSMINFLGETPSNEYLERCNSLVFDEQKYTRNEVCWNESIVQKLEGEIKNMEYFRRYSF